MVGLQDAAMVTASGHEEDSSARWIVTALAFD